MRALLIHQEIEEILGDTCSKTLSRIKDRDLQDARAIAHSTIILSLSDDVLREKGVSTTMLVCGRN